MVVSCFLTTPPSKPSSGVWYPRIICPSGAFCEVCQSEPLAGKHVGKVVCAACSQRKYSPKVHSFGREPPHLAPLVRFCFKNWISTTHNSGSRMAK